LFAEVFFVIEAGPFHGGGSAFGPVQYHKTVGRDCKGL
jgi:hypothetical protein